MEKDFKFEPKHGFLGVFSQAERVLGVLPEAMQYKDCLLLFAADNLLSVEGVSSYRPLSSHRIVEKHLKGQSYSSQLMQRLGKEEIIVDVGLHYEVGQGSILKRRVVGGSADPRRGEGLSLFQVDKALEVGERTVLELYRQGIRVIGLGEIGVGNTIYAYVLTCLVLRLRPEQVVGIGSDSSGITYARRLNLTREIVNFLRHEPVEVRWLLHRAGCVEIAALMGAILAATKMGMVVVLDGLVASVAALLACRWIRGGVLVAASTTLELGHFWLLKELGLKPMLDLKLNYGEGLAAGCALFFLEMAHKFRIKQEFS